MCHSDYGIEMATFWDLLYKDRTIDIPFYVELAKESSPPVLELGCGTGRVLIPIAKEGVNIIGCDNSPNMLCVAQDKADALSPSIREKIRLIESDMRNINLGERFGLIVMAFNSFSYLLTLVEQKNALEKVFDHLQKGGRFVFDILNPEQGRYTDRHSGTASFLKLSGREWKNPNTGNRVVEWFSRSYNLADQVMHEIQIWEEVAIDNTSLKRYYRDRRQRYFFRYEVEHLLENIGFALEAVYGDFSCGPVTPTSTQFVFVARKRS